MKKPDVHPGETRLALLAGGELPLLERWSVGRHVRSCAQCADVVEEYRQLRSETAADALELDDVDWSEMQAEMTANIRLGLAAGAVVNSRPQAGAQNSEAAWTGWRFVAVSASLVFVFGAGLWLGNTPAQSPRSVEISAMQPQVEAGVDGVTLRRTGSALELKSPEGSAAVRTVSWDGTARARYFDGETGQVTIHQVAWEGSDAQ